MKRHVAIDLTLVGVIAFTCPRCGTRRVLSIEPGHKLLSEVKLPPETPPGSLGCVLAHPKTVRCEPCRWDFHAIESRL